MLLAAQYDIYLYQYVLTYTRLKHDHQFLFTTVPADDLAPDGARSSDGPVLTKLLDMLFFKFPRLSIVSSHLCGNLWIKMIENPSVTSSVKGLRRWQINWHIDLGV